MLKTLMLIYTMSLSARRAWIEIVAWLDYSEELLVALRKESVDRNYKANAVDPIQPGVALRKESVDRNTRRTFAYVS